MYLLVIILSHAAHQSVHLTDGSLRHFRALSTPRQNPALEVLSMLCPPVGKTSRWAAEIINHLSKSTNYPV